MVKTLLVFLSFLWSFTLEASDWGSDDEEKIAQCSKLIPRYSKDIELLNIKFEHQEQKNQELQQIVKVSEEEKEKNKKRFFDLMPESQKLCIENFNLEQKIYAQSGFIPQILTPEEEDFCKMMIADLKKAALQALARIEKDRLKQKDPKN